MKPDAKPHWSVYLWPGLPHLWIRGSWAGLALAVGFTVLLNALLATTLVWDEWLPARARLFGGVAVAVLWVLAWLEGRADWRRYLAELSQEGEVDPLERQDRLFRQAQQDYLAGDWVLAEQRLAELLRWYSGDVEAGLMLATMWRRLERYDDACQMLGRLERLEAAGAWRDEIVAERRFMDAIDELPPQGEDVETSGSDVVEDQETEDAAAQDVARPGAVAAECRESSKVADSTEFASVSGAVDDDAQMAKTENDAKKKETARGVDRELDYRADVVEKFEPPESDRTGSQESQHRRAA